MLAALIFALDGVLVESEPPCLQAARLVLEETCRREGRTVTADRLVEGVTAMSGYGAREGFERCRETLDLATPAADLAAAWQERVAAGYLATPLIPGAREIILRWKPHCKVAVASVSPPHLVDTLLRRHELSVFLDSVVIAPEVSHMYEAVARGMDLAPESCIVVEGTVPGVHAARAAGMRCIAIPRRARHGADFSAANRIVQSLGDLTLEYLSGVDQPVLSSEQGCRIAVYARCHPDSRPDVLLPLQRAAAQAMARDRGWEIVASLEEAQVGDGWSTRPEMQRLITMVRAGDVQRVVVTEPSVLATGALHQAEIINEMARHSVSVETVFHRSPMSSGSLG